MQKLNTLLKPLAVIAVVLVLATFANTWSVQAVDAIPTAIPTIAVGNVTVGIDGNSILVCTPPPTKTPKPTHTAPPPPPSNTPVPLPSDTPVQATNTAEIPTEAPTETVAPTQTTEPTDTVVPTVTEKPTATSEPTGTPLPTSTVQITATSMASPTATQAPEATVTVEEKGVTVPISRPQRTCAFYELLGTVSVPGSPRTDVASLMGGVKILTSKVAGNSSQPDIHPDRCSTLMRVVPDGRTAGEIYWAVPMSDGSLQVTNLTNSPKTDDSHPVWISNVEYLYLSKTPENNTYVMKGSIATGKQLFIYTAPDAIDLAALPFYDLVAWTDGKVITYYLLSGRAIGFEDVTQLFEPEDLTWEYNGSVLITNGFPVLLFRNRRDYNYIARDPETSYLFTFGFDVAPDGRRVGIAEDGEVYFLDDQFIATSPVMPIPTNYQYADLDWKNQSPVAIGDGVALKFLDLSSQ